MPKALHVAESDSNSARNPRDPARDPIDACEDQEWYQRLPEHARDEMRAVWERRHGQSTEQRALRKRTTKRYIIEGTLLFLIVVALFFSMNPLVMAVATAVGAGVGAAAAWRRACTYQYGMLAALGYVIFSSVFVGGLSIFAMLFVTIGGTMLGLGHAMNRYDFSEL